MAASMTHPEYKMNLFTANGTKYVLKDVTTDLVVSHEENSIAEKVTITVANVMVGKQRLSKIIKLRQKVYVYANTGSGSKEVFRGFVWERKFKSTDEVKEITLICYDKLIYLQNSKDNFYQKKGATTKNAITLLAKKWGIKIRYNYKSITHGKLVYRSEYISDIFISILNKTKKKTGVGYVIRFEKNVMIIEPQGSNKTVYKVTKGDNELSESYTETMDDMVTKVKIIKSDDKSGNSVTVATVKGKTKEYGTLQDIIEKGSDEKLSEVKKEANNIIKKDGNPKKEITIEALDNPWIKKGHKVYIHTDHLKNYYIVKGIEHDAANHVMAMEVKKA